MEGSNNNVKFNSAAYFSTPVWTAHAPVFLPKMLKLSDGYLKKTQKKIKRIIIRIKLLVLFPFISLIENVILLLLVVKMKMEINFTKNNNKQN